MEPGASITGSVLLPSGGPASGTLDVVAVPSGSTGGVLLFPINSPTTSFVLSGLPAGSWDLTFDRTGYVEQTVTGISVTAGQTLILPPITMTLAGQISGTVVSYDPSVSAADVQVGLFSNGDAIEYTVSDASGNYSFTDLAPGTYTLQVTNLATGVPWTQTITLSSGENQTGLPLYIEEAATINGYLTSTTGGFGVPYAYVQLLCPDGVTVTTLTDGTGYYQFNNLLAGTYTVSSGNATQTLTIAGVNGEYDTVNLQVDVQGILCGQLLTASGQPVSGGTVYLMQNGEQLSAVRTDAAGDYYFFLASPGTYDLEAHVPDASFADVTGIQVATGQSVRQNIMAGTDTLTISLTGQAGAVPGTVVSIAREDLDVLLPAGITTVDNSGAVQFGNLIPGTYQISAVGSNNQGDDMVVTIPGSGSSSVTLNLGQQDTLSGQVTDQNGAPCRTPSLSSKA